jgi:hypothetical protein
MSKVPNYPPPLYKKQERKKKRQKINEPTKQARQNKYFSFDGKKDELEF